MKEIINNPSIICYEDPYLLIINKPAGILVHPTVKEDGTSLYNYVQRYYQDQGLALNVHPVSRLDRFTSGLVLFAKSPQVQYNLSQSKITKTYLALVTKTPPEPQGMIEAPIARKEGSIIERCVSPCGKEARTRYQVIRSCGSLTLVRLELLTGRTHQIRVHCAYIGCPVYQDHLYGPPGPQMRHMLHACSLAFLHPVSGVRLEITCAPPPDMAALIWTGKKSLNSFS